MTPVTQLLQAANRGDKQAAGELLPLVYNQLRKLAADKLAGEKPKRSAAFSSNKPAAIRRQNAVVGSSVPTSTQIALRRPPKTTNCLPCTKRSTDSRSSIRRKPNW
jgi:hypothetical protein